jgi:hypothetical protein
MRAAMMRRTAYLVRRIGKTVVPMPKLFKPVLRHAPLKPLTLDIREDKYEKEDDKGDDDRIGQVSLL